MKHFVKIGFSLLLLVLMASCFHKSNVVFMGEIANLDGQYLTVSKMNLHEMEVMDSVQIQQGKFRIVVPAENDDPAFYCLSLNKENALSTIAQRGDKLHFIIDEQPMVKHYQVTGNHDAELIAELDAHLALFVDSVQFLENKYYEELDNDTLHQLIEDSYLQIKKHHTDYLKAFIAENPNSFASLVAFYQKYNNGIFLSEVVDQEILKNIYQNLNATYPENENLMWLHDRLQKKN